MKKLMTVFMIALLCLSLAACGANVPPEDGPADTALPENATAISFAGSAGEVVEQRAAGEIAFGSYVAITSADGADEFGEKYNYDLSGYDKKFFKNHFILMTSFVQKSSQAGVDISVKSSDSDEIVLDVARLVYKQGGLMGDDMPMFVDAYFIEVPTKYSGQYVTEQERTVVVSMPEEEMAKYRGTVKGRVTCEDNIDLSGIAVAVYEYERVDSTEFELINKYAVYTDAEGRFSFERTTVSCFAYFDLESLPEQYGVRGGIGVNETVFDIEQTFEISRVESIKVDDAVLFYDQPFIGLYDADGEQLLAHYEASELKYGATFVEKILDGWNSYAKITVKCGALEQEHTVDMKVGSEYASLKTRAGRAEKLYEYGFIDKATYESIVAEENEP
ncbi:MAG: hypothetical protein IJY27_01735 [Clostridia bacterium]|nr:hypothetical protein [Clostridia bacterium]